MLLKLCVNPTFFCNQSFSKSEIPVLYHQELPWIVETKLDKSIKD